MSEHERLSAAISSILAFDGLISVDQADGQVVAYSFEKSESIRHMWELAIITACELCPWLLEEDAHLGDWSMNLFTTDGLWRFPSTVNTR